MGIRTRATPPAPLHILVLSKWWPHAGDPQLGDFIRKQMQAVALTEKVTVLLVEPAPVMARTTAGEEDGLFTIRTTYRADKSSWTPWRKAVNFLRYRSAALRGWRQVLATRGLPTLVHAHILVRPALLARWIERHHDIPYVLSEQSSEYLNGTYASKGALFHAVCRRLFKKASAITAVSAWLGDGLKRLDLCEHYDVVPNVIPGLDRPLPVRGSARHFLVVADLVDRTKNVSGVIRALKLASTQAAPLQLTIIGDGPDRGMLEELVSAEGLSGRVHFLGRLPNRAVLDHMAKAGTVVINSNVETFSVVTGEALAQGKPVIATRCGGPQAFITANNGLLIDTGDTAALARAMQQISAWHDHYEPASIRAQLSTRFGPAAVGQAFVDLYHRTLNVER